VALFKFVSWCLVAITVVTLMWPLNVPLAALAYKVRLGYRPIPLERNALWLRATFAALGLCGMTLVLLGLNYALVAGAELKPEQVQIVLLMLYLPAAVAYLFWIFAMEDMLDALGLFLLYILLPGLPLLLLGRLFGWWNTLGREAPWLLFF
jgi:hypothetical protein